MLAIWLMLGNTILWAVPCYLETCAIWYMTWLWSEQYGNIVSRFLYVDDHATTVTLCIVIYLYIRSTTIIKYMVRNAVMLWMNININSNITYRSLGLVQLGPKWPALNLLWQERSKILCTMPFSFFWAWKGPTKIWSNRNPGDRTRE